MIQGNLPYICRFLCHIRYIHMFQRFRCGHLLWTFFTSPYPVISKNALIFPSCLIDSLTWSRIPSSWSSFLRTLTIVLHYLQADKKFDASLILIPWYMTWHFSFSLSLWDIWQSGFQIVGPYPFKRRKEGSNKGKKERINRIEIFIMPSCSSYKYCYMKHLFHLSTCGMLRISKTFQKLACIYLVSETGEFSH